MLPAMERRIIERILTEAFENDYFAAVETDGGLPVRGDILSEMINAIEVAGTCRVELWHWDDEDITRQPAGVIAINEDGNRCEMTGAATDSLLQLIFADAAAAEGGAA